jgi:subtilisin family serine protease
MSSPHVAGVAALVMANEPGITNSRVRIRMQATAQSMFEVSRGFSSKDLYGYGLVDAVRSVSI